MKSKPSEVYHSEFAALFDFIKLYSVFQLIV